MTSFREKERHYYWSVARRLRAACDQRDRAAIAECCDELEGIVANTDDDRLRMTARRTIEQVSENPALEARQA